MRVRVILLFSVVTLAGCAGILPDPRCASDADCAAPHTCHEGVCVAPGAQGSSSEDSGASSGDEDSSKGPAGSSSGVSSSSGGVSAGSSRHGASSSSSSGGASSGRSGSMQGAEDGAACLDGAECQSGSCVDGFCCESACDGACLGCAQVLTGVGNGRCRPVHQGSDPHGDCQDEAAASCGTNGTCDGAGACELYRAGTVCEAANCADGNTANNPSTCDGQRHCVSRGTNACGSFPCINGACAAACSDAEPCGMGAFCNQGTCSAKLQDGQPCMDAATCQSGFCVDGVCCNSACGGTCEACSAAGKAGGANGVCGPVATGMDPGNECDPSAQMTCGTTGGCNGLGACEVFPAGTECSPASCSMTGAFLRADTCNGNGACVDNGLVACGGFVCTAAGCATSCSAAPANCLTGYHCSGNTCVPDMAGGSACTAPSDCASGHCVDGFCCDTACTGTCQACSAALKGSGPNGVCGPVAAGADPQSECNDQGASTCGTNGVCNGSGACARYAANTICNPGTCSAGVQALDDTCDGNGTCVDHGTMSCGTYACAGAACRTSCGGDGDCAAGNTCSALACVGKKAIGSGCSGANECQSGFCVDGMCCDSACAGTCQACTTALKGSGSNGVCGPIAANTDPQSECNDQGQSSCGTNGACNGASACAFYGAGVTCVAASCSAGTLTRADTCNGSGTCTDNGTTPCAPYVCGMNACLTTCNVPADCAAGFYCGSNTCQAKKANGLTCGGPNECTSGNCVDGVCCNTACNGACEACSAVKKGSGGNGVCGNILANTDPDNECADQGIATCGTNGSCNGSGACAHYGNGLTCVAASCSGSTLTRADTCNGTGTCVDNGTQNCGAYVCSGTACLTSCGGSTDCAAGYTCVGSVCKKDLGSGCSAAAECASNFCVDGFCCNSACTGNCRDCGNFSDQGAGYCGTITGFNDGSCLGNQQCCNGVCRNLTFQCDAI